MRRIGSLVVIILVTADTSIRSGVIVPVMALVAGSCDMCTGQLPVIVMGWECCRSPARIGGMAISTGRRNVVSNMIRIGCRVICIDMTGRTCSRCSVETACMTGAAQKGKVSTRQREAVIMVECSTRTAGRMARITSKTVIGITAYSLVAISKCSWIVVGMTINAAESTIICWCCMTFTAKNPCALVFPGIDREILTIVVEGRGAPCSSGMTRLAIGRELGRSVRWIVSLVVIIQVTPDTGIRSCGIITVMTLVATGRDM